MGWWVISKYQCSGVLEGLTWFLQLVMTTTCLGLEQLHASRSYSPQILSTYFFDDSDGLYTGCWTLVWSFRGLLQSLTCSIHMAPTVFTVSPWVTSRRTWFYTGLHSSQTEWYWIEVYGHPSSSWVDAKPSASSGRSQCTYSGRGSGPMWVLSMNLVPWLMEPFADREKS